LSIASTTSIVDTAITQGPARQGLLPTPTIAKSHTTRMWMTMSAIANLNLMSMVNITNNITMVNKDIMNHLHKRHINLKVNHNTVLHPWRTKNTNLSM
jgi:hypothetical protein